MCRKLPRSCQIKPFSVHGVRGREKPLTPHLVERYDHLEGTADTIRCLSTRVEREPVPRIQQTTALLGQYWGSKMRHVSTGLGVAQSSTIGLT